MKTNKGLFTVKNMSVTAMLAALAIVLYQLIELPLNPFVPFLKVNFADVPAVLAGLVISPLAGIVVTGIRCFAHLFRTSTFGIGELADFVVGTAIVVVFCHMQMRFNRTAAGSVLHKIISFGATLIAAVLVGFVINLILYPIYTNLIGKPIESASALFFYLAATAITNAERIILNITICLLLLPLVAKLKKT